MTDARLPDRWLNDRRFLRLSGDAFKLYSIMLMFSVANRTDGFVDDEDLDLLPGVNTGNVAELDDVGLVESTEQGWLITEFPSTQTSRAELEAGEEARRIERERKAKERRQKAEAKADAKSSDGQSNDLSSGQSAGQSDGRPSGHPRLGKAGKDRQGKGPLGKAGVTRDSCRACHKPWEETSGQVEDTGLCVPCMSKHNEGAA